ncbi:DNRLRE domain-containing protein [bacterium]|jgi:hypothetical protein|nr:DNRLRE domain-containing protein [bacterium]
MKTLCTLLTSLGIASSGAQDITILTSDGNGADSYVRQGQATNNFAAANNVVIKGGNGSTTRKAYLRFDLSTVTKPITDASITLTVSTNNSGGASPQPGQTFNVEFYGLTNEALDSWVEGDNGTDNLPENEITYGNAPANVSPGNDFNGEALLLGTLNVPGTLVGESITFTDPNLVAFLNSDTNGLATILMRRQLGGSLNLAFSSKEGATPPQLDLTVGPAAELAISEIVYDSVADAVTLTWRKTGAVSYTARFSTDLMNWDGDIGDELTEAQDENTGDPDNITMTFELFGLATDGKIFFRIEEDPVPVD